MEEDSAQRALPDDRTDAALEAKLNEGLFQGDEVPKGWGYARRKRGTADQIGTLPYNLCKILRFLKIFLEIFEILPPGRGADHTKVVQLAAAGISIDLRSSSAFGSLTASPSTPLPWACPVYWPTNPPPLYRGEPFAIERSLHDAPSPERL
jgi:hypothetical protein